MTTRVKIRALAMAAGILAPALLLSGCGKDPKEVTCSEFAAMSYDEQNDTLDDLLSDHDLDTLSTSNTIGVRQEVDSFCGTSAFGSKTAGRNSGQSIDAAVDWESGVWG